MSDLQNTTPSLDVSDMVTKLLQQDCVIIDEAQWSESLRQDLQAALARHQINDLTVYRSATEPIRYFLCIRGHEIDVSHLEQEYPLRPWHAFLTPLFVMAMLVLGISAVIARDLNRLMSAEFLLWTPFVIGAISQYVYASENPNRIGSIFGTQAIILLALTVFSVVVLREGSICVVMASPLLYMAQMFGAVTMRSICNWIWQPSATVHSLSMLPLVLMLLDPFSSQTTHASTTNEIVINAPVAEVFQSINNIQSIQAHEIQDSFIFRMGFPKPVSGMTVADAHGDGLTRQIHWQRGIYFEEKITHSKENELLAWVYRFTPESFPKGSMDDHVEIGGEYFDLQYTDYRLEKINEHQTKLILTIDYRLSTELNWYAKPWADYVLNQFSDVVLNVYKNRLESF